MATKVALVTAGGSGMGAAVARRLASDGYAVGVLSSSGKGEALGVELGGFGVTGSNQSNDDLKRLVDGALERWGRIDALVNSAGNGPRGSLLEISDEDWHRGLDTYLMNVVRAVRLVAPAMRAQKRGAIVNISTGWAFEPSAMFPTSGVFRAGLAAYANIFADDFCRRQRADEQHPSGLDRQPAGLTGGAARERSDAPLWHDRGDCRDGRFPSLRRSGLYHRAEPAGRRRTDAQRLGVSLAPAASSGGVVAPDRGTSGTLKAIAAAILALAIPAPAAPVPSRQDGERGAGGHPAPAQPTPQPPPARKAPRLAGMTPASTPPTPASTSPTPPSWPALATTPPATTLAATAPMRGRRAPPPRPTPPR